MKDIYQEEFKTMMQVGKISCNLLHDLVGPITSLTMCLENDLDMDLTEVSKNLQETNTQIKEFIGIIQETVENPETISVMELEKVISSAIFLGRHKALKENVQVIFIRNTNNIKIRANKLQIYQLIMNLVGNSVDALKEIEREKKTVTVNLSENVTGLRIAVIDNGCGIKKENLDNIFKKKFSTKPNGTGIGLNTVKNIVEDKLNGKIIVKSEPNIGTRFHISLPKELIVE